MRCLLAICAVLAAVFRGLGQDVRPPQDPGLSKTNLVDAETRELKPGDEFSFRVDEDPGKSPEPMRVVATELGDAYFRVSRISDTSVAVNVRGKRLDDIRREVREKLEKDYYQKASITLNLVGIGGLNPASSSSLGKVIFFGEMKGMLPLPEGEKMTLSEAVLRLGGGTPFANLKRVKVSRKDSKTGKTKVMVVNVDSVLHDNKNSEDIELQDGDRVEVLAKSFNF